MSQLVAKGYKQFLGEIKKEVQKRRYKALRNLNRELVNLCWEIGRRIVQKQEKSGWGEAVVERLAGDLSVAFPDAKGFSEQNLWRMRQFYLEYRKEPKLSPLVREISWTNNLLIMTSFKGRIEREFYIRMAIKEKWTKRQLERQIDTGLFNRYMASKTSKKTLLVPMEESKAIASLKDHYVLDFLGLEEVYSEKELRRAILSNLRDFFLEFGKNLTFVGEEYPLRVGDDFFKIDLLFYHRELCCLVPVELKLGKFKPEYVGQMQFYLAALDEQVRLYHERPSIGLILCKSKNDETVRIAISQAVKKIGVAIYQTKLPARKLLAEKLHQIQLPEGA